MFSIAQAWGAIKGIFTRTSLENPSIPLDSKEAYDLLAGSTMTDIGIPVNRRSALALPAWYRVNSLVAGSIGKAPFHTYRRVKTKYGDGKERATDHPLYQRLRYEPNEDQTADVYIGQITHHAFSVGNGYSYIERNGRDISLWPLEPDKVLPVRVKAGDDPLAPARLQYVWTNGQSGVRFEPHEIHHLKGFGYDGLCGYNVIELLKESFGLALSQQKFYSVAIKNGATPRIVLEIPKFATEAQIKHLRESFDSIHAGIDNAHKTLILEGGMTAKPVGFSPDDIKLVESRKLSLVDIANIAGLPVHKVGGEGTRSYASLEQEELSVLNECFDFWLVRWEQESRKKLLTEREKSEDSIVLEFLRESFVRMDAVAQAAYNRAALAGQPWETVNEVRARKNLNPVEGGDVIKQPLNMSDPGGINNTPNDPAADNVKPTGPNSGNGDPKKKRDVVDLLIAEAERRAVKRIAIHAEKAAKHPQSFSRWLDSMIGEHRTAVQAILTPAYQARSILDDAEIEPTTDIDKFLTGLRGELLELSERATYKNLTEKVAAWSASKEKLA